MIRRGLRQADRIVCDSDATRRDVQRIVRPGDYAVIPPGVSPIFARRAAGRGAARARVAAPARRAIPPPGLAIASGPYLLHVGGNQWYKNRAGLIETYAALVERMPAAPPLVIVGKPLHARADGRHRRAARCRDASSPCDAVGDRELAAVYSRAALLLFPSLAEGFGWPVLEAMACGCRVVTSNRAADDRSRRRRRDLSSIRRIRRAPRRSSKRCCASPSAERDSTGAATGLSRAAAFNSRAMARAYLSVYHRRRRPTAERRLTALRACASCTSFPSLNPAGGGPIEAVTRLGLEYRRQGTDVEILTLDDPRMRTGSRTFRCRTTRSGRRF